jgi:putative ABC transport system ATP-binding protein
MADIVRCRGVLRVYRTAAGEVQALRGVDVGFARGEMTALVGPSGSGKSSLLRIVAGLDPVTGGEVSVDGTAITELDGRGRRRFRRRHVGYLWQRPSANLVAHLTVRQNIALAAASRGLRRPKADDVLAPLGLAGFGGRVAGTLSGGEQQRLGVGLAALGEPPLLLADEPTAELDREAAALVVDLLAAERRAGRSVVVATHDPRVVGVVDHVVAIDHGTVSGFGVGTEEVAAVDGQGRVRLPAAALGLFPDGRAAVEVGDDHVTLRRPR